MYNHSNDNFNNKHLDVIRARISEFFNTSDELQHNYYGMFLLKIFAESVKIKSTDQQKTSRHIIEYIEISKNKHLRKSTNLFKICCIYSHPLFT